MAELSRKLGWHTDRCTANFRKPYLLSDRWIFKFHTFSEIGSQDLSKSFKINPIRGSWVWWPSKGRRLEKRVGAINSPSLPTNQERPLFWVFALCLENFRAFFPLFQKKKKKRTHKKYIKASLFPFSLRWFVLGILCCVPFVLISRVWRPLFIFLPIFWAML